MRYLALIVALLAVTIGITGVVAPETLFAMMRYAGTPAGLYAAAVGRVAVGVVLIMVAPRSRAPGLLRGLGGLIMLAGMMTPFFGVGSPSKMYQKSSLPTSTSTLGKNSAMGEFRLAMTTW